MAEKKRIKLINDEDVLKKSEDAYELALSGSGPLTEEQKVKVRRLEFSTKTKIVLAQRVGYRCSCPDCENITIGPGDEPGSVVVLGEAAHIVGAVKSDDNLSPRADSTKTDEEIRSLENGIWLCRHHHRLIDSKEKSFSVSDLKMWKAQAEAKQAELMKIKEPLFVEKYIRPQIQNSAKGIDTQKFKDKEWCLLAYLMESYNNREYSNEFEPDEDGHCFECDYQNWMSVNNIDSSISQIRFNAFYKDKLSDIREIVNNLTGLVIIGQYGLYYGKVFDDFCELLFNADEKALEKIKKDLSKV